MNTTSRVVVVTGKSASQYLAKKVKKLLHLNNRMVNFLVLMYALSVFMLNIFSYLVHDNQWYSFAIKTVIVWELIAGTIANLHPPLKS